MAKFFENYVPPAVYAEVRRETGTVNPGLFARVPFFVGKGREVRQINNYEIHRGSSAQADYQIIGEDLSSQANGVNTEFYTAYSPISDGTGKLLVDVFGLKITVDGRSVQPLLINAAAGMIKLPVPPASTAKVLVNYFFDTRDQYIPDEDLSIQVASGNKVFYVSQPVITDGTNAGTATTNPTAVTVKVNGVALPKNQIASVDGTSGMVQLVSAPQSGDRVQVSYYRANWVDKWDVLPSQSVASILSVGDMPNQAKYIPGTDFVLANNRLMWGSAFLMSAAYTVPNSLPLSAAQVQALMKDQWMVGQQAVQTGDGIRKVFTTGRPLCEGTGQASLTYNPSLIRVFVGSDPVSARASGAVRVNRISYPNQEIVLDAAPAVGAKVFVDFYTSFLADANFYLECVTSGGVGQGTFLIRNDKNEIIPSIDQTLATVADPDFASEGITYNQTGKDFRVTPGYSIPETITLTFTSSTGFSVTSSEAEGSVGAGSLDQTYYDPRTGVVFTIMSGQTVHYAAGDTIVFEVTNSPRPVSPSKPIGDIMGLQILVPSMQDIETGSTLAISTYRKEGQEPLVGAYYYVTYLENKAEADFGMKFWSVDEKDLVYEEYGKPSLENELSLAAKIAFDAGAQFIGTVQGRVDPLTDAMTTEEINRCIMEIEREWSVDAFYVCPLTADPSHLALFKAHDDKMATLRYSRPRLLTCSNPSDSTYLEVLGTLGARVSTNVINFWPCDPVMKLISPNGIEQEYVVPAYMVAAAYCGLKANPAYDCAEPGTRKLLPWFVGLVTPNDQTKQNLMASRGCTVLENYQGTIRIRDEVTTDSTSVTRSEVPAASTGVFLVQMIKATLDRYVGRKALDGINTDIQRDVNAAVSSLKPNILRAVYSVTVSNVEGDPTMRYVEVECEPIVTLKRLVVRFQYRFA